MQSQQTIPDVTPDPTICHQSHCPLRREGVDADLLADALVAVLAGEDVPRALEVGTIARKDLCTECVRSIFEGRPKPLTEAEAREKAARAARRLVRRAHRQRRRA